MYFSEQLVAYNLTDVQQGNILLSGGLFEEVKAICSGKMHRIRTEIDKNTKKFRFLKILCSFCVLFEKLGGLENQIRSTRNKFVVREALLKS